MKIKEDEDDVIALTGRTCDQLSSSVLYKLEPSDEVLGDIIEKRIAVVGFA